MKSQFSDPGGSTYWNPANHYLLSKRHMNCADWRVINLNFEDSVSKQSVLELSL